MQGSVRPSRRAGVRPRLVGSSHCRRKHKRLCFVMSINFFGVERAARRCGRPFEAPRQRVSRQRSLDVPLPEGRGREGEGALPSSRDRAAARGDTLGGPSPQTGSAGGRSSWPRSETSATSRGGERHGRRRRPRRRHVGRTLLPDTVEDPRGMRRE